MYGTLSLLLRANLMTSKTTAKLSELVDDPLLSVDLTDMKYKMWGAISDSRDVNIRCCLQGVAPFSLCSMKYFCVPGSTKEISLDKKQWLTANYMLLDRKTGEEKLFLKMHYDHTPCFITLLSHDRLSFLSRPALKTYDHHRKNRKEKIVAVKLALMAPHTDVL